jgi:Zn-dependent peptidase ImmA (M78 family)
MTISIKRKIELGKEAKELAIQQRREWELGIEPIPSVFSLLESKGILIVRFPAENCDLSGFAMKLWNRSCIYINSNDVLGRQIFSSAHELCHLIHDLTTESIKVCYHSAEEEVDEYRAERFAAEFLMPQEKVIEICDSLVGNNHRLTKVEQVIELQHRFKVSFSAMLNRLLRTRRISKALYDNLKKLSTISRIVDLHKLTLNTGKSLDLIIKSDPYIPYHFIDTLNKNYHDGLITWEKFQSVLQLIGKGEDSELPGGEP